MKIFFLACCYFLILDVCRAQTEGQHISVLLLKENSEIDDLMNLALKDEPRLGRANKPTLRDSCWLLEKAEPDGSKIAYLSIMPGKKTAINYYVNDFEHKNQKYGFFPFKGYLVFVNLEAGLDDFFVNTGTYRTFYFLFPSNNIAVLQSDLYDHFMRYQYINGRMSEQGGPSALEVHFK